MDAETLECGLVLRQLGHPQVIRPCGEVAGGKGCLPAANDLVSRGQNQPDQETGRADFVSE